MSERKELLKVYGIYIALFVLIIIINGISMNLIDGKIALITGIVWVVVTCFIYFFLVREKEDSTIIYSILNAIIAGIAMSSYYSIRSVLPYNPFLLAAIFIIIMLLNYAIIINLKKRRSFIKYIIIATIIVIIIFSIIWTDTNKSLGSSLVFLSVIYLCFNLAIYRDIDKGPSYIRILGKASLFMFAGVIVTVIVALSEGELLDLFGGSYTGEKDKKKMK